MPRFPAPSMFAAATLIAALCACSGEGGGGAGTSAAAPPVIKERHDNFEAIGDASKAVRSELEKETPDFARITASAQDINSRATRITGYFPAGTSVEDGYKTEALPAIWAKPAEFEVAAQKLVDESAALVTVAQSADKAAVGAQAMATGGACKGCHDQFRLDDKK